MVFYSINAASKLFLVYTYVPSLGKESTFQPQPQRQQQQHTFNYIAHLELTVN